MHGFVTSRPGSVNKPLNTSGKNLRRRLHGKPARVRARVAAKLVTGEWALANLLPAQAARLCGVHPQYVVAALNGPRISRPVTEADIDRIVIRLGPERVLGALDRATAPNGNGAPA